MQNDIDGMLQERLTIPRIAYQAPLSWDPIGYFWVNSTSTSVPIVAMDNEVRSYYRNKRYFNILQDESVGEYCSDTSVRKRFLILEFCFAGKGP